MLFLADIHQFSRSSKGLRIFPIIVGVYTSFSSSSGKVVGSVEAAMIHSFGWRSDSWRRLLLLFLLEKYSSRLFLHRRFSGNVVVVIDWLVSKLDGRDGSCCRCCSCNAFFNRRRLSFCCNYFCGASPHVLVAPIISFFVVYINIYILQLGNLTTDGSALPFFGPTIRESLYSE